VTATLDVDGWRAQWYEVGEGLDVGAHETDHDDQDWHPTSVPATAHQLLLDNDLIDDPFAHGARDYDWPADHEWWYRRTFSADAAWQGRTVRLNVHGVMEHGQVYVNGELVLQTTSMYEDATVDVSEHLDYGRENTIAV
jgi:beta-galactosidase/beta-glucuronidase